MPTSRNHGWLSRKFTRTRKINKRNALPLARLDFETLESRRMLASLVLGGTQAIVPGATINVSADNTAFQSEMSVVINPTNPLNLVGFSHRLIPGGATVLDVYRSTNGGTNWTTTQIDNADDFQGGGVRYDPALIFDANGRLYIAYGYRGQAIAPAIPSQLIAATSTDGGITFGNYVALDTRADIVTASTTDNDLPGVDRWTLATGRDPASGNQAVYVTYTQNVTEGAAGTDQRIVIRGTRDGGANWDATATINDGSIAGTDAGNLGTSPIVTFGGEVFVTWWDGGTSIIADRDRDGLWATAFNFGTDLVVRNNAGLVNIGPTGPPAQPERGLKFAPSLAVNLFNRDLYITCHQQVTGNDTNIIFGRSSDFGDTWTWSTVDFGTGTEFNPWIAWDINSGALGIAYYTTEGDQATGNDDVRPRMAVSSDNGNSWGLAFLSAQISNEGVNGPGGVGYGGDYLEYIGFAFRDGTAHCLWASRRIGGGLGGTDLDAFTTRVSLDSATNGNVLRIAGIGGQPDDSTVIRRAPLNNNFVEVFENGVRTYTGLLASIDSITIETGGGVHAFSIENLPAIPVNMFGSSGVDVITFSALSGVSGLTFFGGDGADIITLGTGAFDANTISSPVTIFGDAGADTLVMGSGNADAVAANVTFNGGTGGGNSIVYVDTTPTYVLRYDVFSNKVNRDGINAPFDLFYSNVTNITAHLGASGDTFAIRSGVTAVVHAFGNGGNDNFIVGGGNLNGFFPQDLNGGPGTDQITFDDSLNPAGKLWDINQDFHPNEILYAGLISLFTTGFESVGILAGLGIDNITFHNDIRQNYSVNGGALNANTFRWNAANNYFRNPDGPDAIYAVDLVLGPQYAGNLLLFEDFSRLETDYYLTDSLAQGFDTNTSLDGFEVTYHNADYLTINGSNERNTFQLASAHPDTSYSFFARGGNDRFDLTLDTAVGGPSIRTDGNDGSDSLFITDAAFSGPATYLLNSALTRSSAGGSRYFSINTVESLTVTGTAAADTFTVNSLSTARPLTLNGAGGDDTYNVFGSAFGASAPVSLTLADSAGFDTFNLNDQDLTSVSNAVYQANAVGVVRVGTQIPYTGIDITNINSGAGADLLEVFTLPATAGQLRFFGGAGNDALTTPTLILNNIAGPITFDGQGGTNNAITLNDNLDSTGDTVHLDGSSLGAYPGDSLFGAGGSLSFSNTNGLTLTLGSGADTVYAQPNVSATVSINGADPPIGPGVRDRLNLALANAVNYVVNGTPASGNVTSTNLKTLTYSGFESGASIDAIAPTVNIVDVTPDPRTTSVASILIDFTEAVTGFNLLDLTLTLGGGANLLPASATLISGDQIHWTLGNLGGLTLTSGDYLLTLNMVGSGIADLFGNAMLVGASDAWTANIPPLMGDANGDNMVNIFDVNLVSAHWGEMGPLGDVNHDNMVNIFDINLISANWGEVPGGGGGGGAESSLRGQPSAAPEPTASATTASPVADDASSTLLDMIASSKDDTLYPPRQDANRRVEWTALGRHFAMAVPTAPSVRLSDLSRAALDSAIATTTPSTRPNASTTLPRPESHGLGQRFHANALAKATEAKATDELFGDDNIESLLDSSSVDNRVRTRWSGFVA